MKNKILFFICFVFIIANIFSEEKSEFDKKPLNNESNSLNILIKETPQSKTFYNTELKKECTVTYINKENTIPIKVSDLITFSIYSMLELKGSDSVEDITTEFLMRNTTETDIDLYNKSNSDCYWYMNSFKGNQAFIIVKREKSDLHDGSDVNLLYIIY